MTPDQFMAFADPLPESMWLISGVGTILACNRAAEEQTGIPRRDLQLMRMADLVADSEADLTRYLKSCLRNRQLVPGALHLRRHQDSPLACRAEGAVLRPRTEDEDGILLLRILPRESAVEQFSALNQRIADLGKEVHRRRQAEQISREEEERLRVTLHSIGDGVVVTDAIGEVVAMNPVAEDLTGWLNEDAVGQPLDVVFQIVNETSRDVVDNPALRALREGVIVGLANHTILIAKDGTECPIDDSAAPIRTSPDVMIGAVLVFRDISEKKRAEAALRTSEAQLRQLADAMPQMVWAARPDGIIDYYNERWYEYTGFSRDVDGPHNWDSILHREDVRLCNETYAQRMLDGHPWQIEFRFKEHATNGYRWFLGRAVPVKDEQGDIVRWFGTCTDIDATKRSQHTSDFLADASATLANLDAPDTTLHKVASIAVPSFADWCVVDLYENGERKRVAATHTDPEKVRVAQDLAERYPPRPSDPHGVSRVINSGLPELVEDIPDSLLDAVAHDAEHSRILRELGLTSYLCVPLQLRGQIRGVLSFVMAESGRRFSASDLRVAQELASRAAVAIENAGLYRALQEEDRRKDEFLATLAHELRNPLAPIRTGLQLMSMARDNDALIEQTRGMMERQLGQMVHIIDDLLDVSRISRGKLELRKERIELATVIDNALETCDPLLKQSRHQLALSVPSTPIYLNADKTRLAQVLCNLLNNAVKYTEDGGRISLRVESQNDHVLVAIEDSGVGIPREMLPKVFEMFTQVDRSLEKSQGGLGIGLTIVKRLVELHGGSVEAHSEGRDMGSAFVVKLPMAEPLLANPTQRNRQRPATTAESCRILVVDDNVDAGNTLSMMLRILGNEVQTAHDGLQGCEMAAAFRPHLILMDIGMPRLNGYDACRRIREQPWGRSMILVALTGWGQNDDKLRSQEAGFDHHLVKPIEPAMLCELLSTLRA